MTDLLKNYSIFILNHYKQTTRTSKITVHQKELSWRLPSSQAEHNWRDLHKTNMIITSYKKQWIIFDPLNYCYVITQTIFYGYKRQQNLDDAKSNQPLIYCCLHILNNNAEFINILSMKLTNFNRMLAYFLLMLINLF